jgi:hypothetical protein
MQSVLRKWEKSIAIQIFFVIDLVINKARSVRQSEVLTIKKGSYLILAYDMVWSHHFVVFVV